MRSLTDLIRDELEASRTGDFPIVLATIDHEAFTFPFRFSTDNQDLTYNGELYFGWSLDIILPGDTDDPGQGRISIQNVDEQVGSVLQSIATPLTIDLKVLWRSDFTETEGGGGPALDVAGSTNDDLLLTNGTDSLLLVDGISLLGLMTSAGSGVGGGVPDFGGDLSVSTPSLWWRRALYITNVSITDELITGTISGDDLVTEPWPYHRAIRSLLPAIYR